MFKINNWNPIFCLSLVVIWTACAPLPPPPGSQANQVNRDEKEYDKRKKRDKDRDDVLKSARKGPVCSDEENREHKCKKQCRDIYPRRGDREECLDLSIKQIDRLSQLHELLEKPYSDKLIEDIDPDDFNVFLKLSIAPWDKLVEDYSSKQAKQVFVWLIKSPDSAKTFEKADDDQKTLNVLLKRLASFTGNNHHEPFTVRIDRRENLMEQAVKSNKALAEWFVEYINEHNGYCDNNDELSLNCFKVYCKIAKSMDEDSRSTWLNIKSWTAYIDDIIKEGTNGARRPSSSEWDTDEIESSDDLTDWYTDLCPPV